MLDIEDIIGSDSVLTGRLQDGKFASGFSGHPYGRPVGSKNKANLGGPISQETLNLLETLSKDDLIGVIRRVSGAIWAVGVLTEEETYQAMLDKLAIIGLTTDDVKDSLSYIKEWIDRKKGKPIGTSPTVQIGTSGDLNVMIRLVDAAGKVETIQG